MEDGSRMLLCITYYTLQNPWLHTYHGRLRKHRKYVSTNCTTSACTYVSCCGGHRPYVALRKFDVRARDARVGTSDVCRVACS
jgi:hypothetical protein